MGKPVEYLRTWDQETWNKNKKSNKLVKLTMGKENVMLRCQQIRMMVK